MLTLCLLEQHSSPEWYPDRKGWRKGWSVAFISSERLGGSLFSKRVQYVMGGGSTAQANSDSKLNCRSKCFIYLSHLLVRLYICDKEGSFKERLRTYLCYYTFSCYGSVWCNTLFPPKPVTFLYFFSYSFPLSSPSPQWSRWAGVEKKPADFILFFIVLFFLWPASELGCVAGDFLSLKFYNFSRCFGSHRILIQLQLRANSAKFSTVYQ